MEPRSQSPARPAPGAEKSPFHRALLNLGELHDQEVQALREQLECVFSSVEEEPNGWRQRLGSKGTAAGAEKPIESSAAPQGAWRVLDSSTSSKRASELSLENAPAAEKAPSPPPQSLRQKLRHSAFSRQLSRNVGEGRFTVTLSDSKDSRWRRHSMYSGSKHSSPHADTSVMMKDWKHEKRQAEPTRLTALSESRVMKWKLIAAGTIVRMPAFDALCSIMIIANAVLMGVAADWRAQHYTELSLPEGFRFMDRVFTCWFLLELLLRISGHGLQFFVHRKHWSWNVLDFCVVSGDVVTMLIDVSSPDSFGKPGGHLLMVRLLRVLRITKALLIVRIFRFFKELRMMVSSVLRSGSSLVWSIALFMLNLFLFSVFFTGQVAAYKQEEEGRDPALTEELDKFFSSLRATILTLFMSVSGGISWVEVNGPLHAVHWTNSWVFTFFIFFTLFALTNIITGVFVDTAIQSAQSDREEVIHATLAERNATLQQVQEILEDADMDKDGVITLEEFEGHLNDKRIHAHLEVLGLHLDEARELFRLLDTSKGGAIGIEEFMFGCMRLKGNARSIDLATMQYEHKKMHKMLTFFFDYVEREFNQLRKLSKSLQVNGDPPTGPPAASCAQEEQPNGSPGFQSL